MHQLDLFFKNLIQDIRVVIIRQKNDISSYSDSAVALLHAACQYDDFFIG